MPNLNFYRTRISEHREAVYDYDTGMRYTYGDLENRANRLAWFLTHKLKLEKGDRIGFCATNSVSFIDAFYASCKTGIIVTTYNCLLKESELVGLVKEEDPKVIFYSSQYLETMNTIKAAGERHFIALDDDSAEFSYKNIMLLEAGPLPKIRQQPEDIQLLIHTGGTTGRPKAAMLSYRALFYNAISEILTLQLSEQDCAYVFLPFFHTAAWNVLTMPLLMAGGRIIISSKFDPGATLRIIEQERPTVGMAVETIYKALLAHPNFQKTDFSSYRWMVSGAAPISRETLELYWNRGIKLANGYGMTEIGPNNLMHPINNMSWDQIKAKWNSAGVPMYFNHVRIVDADGNDVPDGERGELIWRSNMVFSGYWNNPSASEGMLTNGSWVHSGDVGYKDEDGFFYICGRIKNMYISGGENIFPLEIEEVIAAHPAVAECCIIGIPDEKWGEVGKALVVLAPGQTISGKEIQALVLQELSKIKVPKEVVVVSEIPKNSVGKRDQALIAKKYANDDMAS